MSGNISAINKPNLTQLDVSCSKEDAIVYQEKEILVVRELVEGHVVEGHEVVLNETIEPEAKADVVREEGVEFIQGRIPLPAQKEITLESAMKTQMVLLQADLDSGKVSISL